MFYADSSLLTYSVFFFPGVGICYFSLSIWLYCELWRYPNPEHFLITVPISALNLKLFSVFSDSFVMQRFLPVRTSVSADITFGFWHVLQSMSYNVLANTNSSLRLFISCCKTMSCCFNLLLLQTFLCGIDLFLFQTLSLLFHIIRRG